MKFNYKNRGFVVLSLSLMLIAVGVVNYQLSKDSTLSVWLRPNYYRNSAMDTKYTLTIADNTSQSK